jgi:ribonuclease P/MRP protein subunit RPP1
MKNCMQAYDLHVHSAFSGGSSSLEELASTAKQLGYKGICFVAYLMSKREEEILKAEIERTKTLFNIDIFLGFEARNKRELEILKRRRKEFDILLVRGGDIRMNRIAVQTRGVQILTHPEYERFDPGLNHVLARFAAENNVAIEINFREVLITSKRTRENVLRNITKDVKLAKKFHAPIIICSGALSHWMMRDPYILASFATQVGLELKEAKDAITKVPKRIIEEAKERRSEGWIMEGVKVLG